ncbi:hypothetical protein TNCT_392761 [Trichonephila clavata]|uniref:Uncharacterized protein n=1 Tax=Trichonephila clavata TaxID=2740835 RepID=A0A8X6LLT6_TRICU|nr:hypothetical protein TNCT_392761 [Trichonephila clavata]
MRDYRARKQVRIQSNSDYSSVVQVDKILQADDDLNSSHEFVGLPCQVSMRYVEKHQLSVCESTNVVE